MATDDDFDEFFARHYDRVRRDLTVGFGDAALAEECAQEAFTRALSDWPRVRSMERPLGWVHVVAVNHARRQLRRKDRSWSELAAERGEGVDPATGVVGAIELERLLRLLPPRQRLAVALRYGADLTIDEIAEAMRAAPGTVKATLHAALAKLRIIGLDTSEELEPYAR